MNRPIPPFLASQPRWVLWREVTAENGRKTKPPFRVVGTGGASHDNPQHWAPYALAERVLRNAPDGRWNGLGIVLGKLDDQPEHLCGLDLDQCLHNGAVAAWAQPFLDHLRSYSEVSPSGAGIKVLFRLRLADLPAFRHALELADHEHGRKRTFGTAPTQGDRAPAAEIYTSHRYFTVTAARFADAPDTVELIGADQLSALAELMGPRTSPQPAERRAGDGSAAPDDEEALDEEALEAKLEAALRRYPKLRARWTGDTTGLADATRSGFDMSLGGMLKARAFTYAEMRGALQRCAHSAAREQPERYVRRIWERTAAAVPEQSSPRSLSAAAAALREEATPMPDVNGVAAAPDPWPGEPYPDREEAPEPANDGPKHPNGQEGPDDLEGFALNEDGIALAFAEKHAARLRYCHSTGAWFVWNGTSWRRDGKQLGFAWCRNLCRQMADAQDKDGKRNLLAKAATAVAVERFARSDQRLAVTKEVWDTDPWLLGTPGGTVDLRTGKLRPATPEEHITKLAGAAPAETEDCPRWLRFMSEVTGDDDALVRFLRQWCGYCLTGLTREEALLFIHGHGGNGKSKFLAAVQAMLGNYHATADMGTFTAKKNESHTTDLAMLAGARMVTASETSEGRAWDERRINAVTGNDQITARFMHKDNFTFRPEFKLLIVGNHMPVLRNVNDAAKRRFNIVPFTFKPAVRDDRLEEKLLAELPGILR